MVKILLTSDLHFTSSGFRYKKNGYMDAVINTLKLGNIDANIITGDLTDLDSDGKHFCCIPYGGKEDQMTPLKNTYIKAVEKYTKVYVCLGNHDWAQIDPFTYRPMKNYIIQKYGNLRYVFGIGDICFISLNIFPDDDSLNFLQKYLKNSPKYPIILFFHYNLTGAWSDWWTDAQKEKFYNVIKNSNIIGLFVGHRHETYTDTWHGIPIVSGAGDDSFYIVDIDDKTFKITTQQVMV